MSELLRSGRAVEVLFVKSNSVSWLLALATVWVVGLMVSQDAYGESKEQAKVERPLNVVLILADDLGGMDLGCYGSKFHRTPNIDRLAKSGIRFVNAYSASPLCSPTRASILTGMSPARTGITAPTCHMPEVRLKKELTRPNAKQPLRIAESLTRLSTDYVTLAEQFKQRGYRTAHFGKWHLGAEPYSPLQQGFEVDLPHTPGPGPGGANGYFAPWAFWKDAGKPGEHIEDRMAQEAVNYIEQHQDEPFFLNYWSFSVHSPWMAKEDLTADYAQRVDPASPQRNAMYAAMIESLDQAVGKILDALDKHQLTDRTLVIFTSDNGGWHSPPKQAPKNPEWESIPVTSNAPYRSGKASLYEGGTRVPLLASLPKVVPANQVSDELIQSVDLFATILEATKIALPNGEFDSVSAWDAIQGGRSQREEIYCHFPHGGRAQAASIDGFLPGTYIHRGDWKLIRFYADQDDGADRLELYNLKDDVGETKNLATENPEIANELNSRISEYLVRTEAVVPERNPSYKPSASQASASDPLVGWKMRGCEASIGEGCLIAKAVGPKPFIGFSAGAKHSGKSEVTLVLRNTQPGRGEIHWLPEGVQDKPHIASYTLQGGETETVQIPLEVANKMGIIRIYFPEVQTSDRSENPPRKSWSVVPQFEIDKIAIESMGSSSPPKAAITISDW
jgi:arylsulfatase A-like enzyme